MDETDRQSIDEDPRRGSPAPEWEVFVRTDETGPLKHVGSVSETGDGDAYARASELFGWAAVDLWLCPASEVERYSARSFGPVSDEEGPTGNEPQSTTVDETARTTVDETESTMGDEPLHAFPGGLPEVSDS